MNLPMQDNTAGERSRRLPAAVSGGIRLSPKQAVRSVPTPSLGCQPTLPCQHVAARGVTGKTGGGGGEETRVSVASQEIVTAHAATGIASFRASRSLNEHIVFAIAATSYLARPFAASFLRQG